MIWRLGHRSGEPLFFLLAELGEQRFQASGEGLLGAVGGGQELVESAQPQKPAQVAQATVIGQPEHQMQGDVQAVEELKPVG